MFSEWQSWKIDPDPNIVYELKSNKSLEKHEEFEKVKTN